MYVVLMLMGVARIMLGRDGIQAKALRNGNGAP